MAEYQFQDNELEFVDNYFNMAEFDDEPLAFSENSAPRVYGGNNDPSDSDFISDDFDIVQTSYRCNGRYLIGTIDQGLWLRPSKDVTIIIAYSDVDWAGCPNNCRSTSGYAVFLRGNLISWRSKKQPTVSKSSTEAEYRVVAYTVTDTLHLRSLLTKLGLVVRNPVKLMCDNVSATYLTVNIVQHYRSNHIVVDYHFVRKRVTHGDLIVHFVPTQLQIADMFTKVLSCQCFEFLKSNMHAVSPSIYITSTSLFSSQLATLYIYAWLP